MTSSSSSSAWFVSGISLCTDTFLILTILLFWNERQRLLKAKETKNDDLTIRWFPYYDATNLHSGGMLIVIPVLLAFPLAITVLILGNSGVFDGQGSRDIDTVYLKCPTYWIILSVISTYIYFNVNFVLSGEIQKEFFLRTSLTYMKKKYPGFDYDTFYAHCKVCKIDVFPINQFEEALSREASKGLSEQKLVIIFEKWLHPFEVWEECKKLRASYRRGKYENIKKAEVFYKSL